MVNPLALALAGFLSVFFSGRLLFHRRLDIPPQCRKTLFCILQEGKTTGPKIKKGKKKICACVCVEGSRMSRGARQIS